MPIIINIYPDRELAIIKAGGALGDDEITRCDVNLCNHPDWRNGFKILADCTEIERISLSRSEMERLVAHNKIHNQLFSKSKFAVAASKDLIFGLARMWDTMADDLTLERAVFRDVDKAMEWLEE